MPPQSEPHAEVAREIFKNEDLSNEIEKSAQAWGGEDVEVRDLAPESQDAAFGLLKVVYINAREKSQQDQDLSIEETSAVELCERIFETQQDQADIRAQMESASGEEARKLLERKLAEAGLVPKEQAQLYVTLRGLEERLNEEDDSLAAELKLVDSSGDEKRKSEYQNDVHTLSQDILFNLTGIDPMEGVAEYSREVVEADIKAEEIWKADESVTEDGLKGKGQRILARRGAKSEAKKVVKELRKEARKEGKKKEGGEDVFKDEYERRLQEYREELMKEGKPNFTPEENLAGQADRAVEACKENMRNYLEKQVMTSKKRDWRDNLTDNQRGLRSLIGDVEAVTSLAGMEAAMKDIDEFLDIAGADSARKGVKKKYEKSKPEKKAAEVVLEDMVALKYDALAVKALQREVGKSPGELKSAVTRYGKTIVRLEKIKKRTKEQESDLVEARRKSELANRALELVNPKSGELDQLLKTSPEDLKIEKLKDKLPKGSGLELENAIADELDVALPPGPNEKARYDARRVEINKKLGDMNNFSILALLLRFIGIEL